MGTSQCTAHTEDEAIKQVRASAVLLFSFSLKGARSFQRRARTVAVHLTVTAVHIFTQALLPCVSLVDSSTVHAYGCWPPSSSQSTGVKYDAPALLMCDGSMDSRWPVRTICASRAWSPRACMAGFMPCMGHPCMLTTELMQTHVDHYRSSISFSLDTVMHTCNSSFN
jgi:hypothetical protein